MLWNTPDRPLVLASQSPRRREILSLLGVAHTAISPILENENEWLNAAAIEDSIQNLAKAKAASIASAHPASLVLGSDTIVVIDGTILGKPADTTEARSMLKQLRARTHTVFSGVALLCEDASFSHTEVAATRVCFRDFSDAELESYIDTGESSDKAGAYAIQGRGAALVDSIHGCFYNVMGLPTGATIACLSAYIEHTQRIY